MSEEPLEELFDEVEPVEVLDAVDDMGDMPQKPKKKKDLVDHFNCGRRASLGLLLCNSDCGLFRASARRLFGSNAQAGTNIEPGLNFL